MTTREEIIAAAKEAEFGTLTPYGEECAERFYTIAFEAGAASRDAEIQRLQFALADSEALELGTAERCDQLRAELEYDQRNAAMSQSESARLLDENTKLRAELVKALAACKAKDEALNTIVTVFYPKGIWKQAREALAIQPDDSALKAWLGAPVAWEFTDAFGTHYTDYQRDWMDTPGIESVTCLYSPKGLK